MCDAVCGSTAAEREKTETVGFYGFYEPCAARRNEADGSIGLVLWVLPGAITSQM